MTKFKAVIFDCDGVLMDSEYLACSVSARILTENGYPISTDEYIDRFMGKGFSETIKLVSLETNNPKFAEIQKSERNAIRKVIYNNELKATPYTVDIVKNLTLPNCIASGSSMERLNETLKIVGLYDYFEGRIFSSELVENGKPAPDVFLYAAKQIGIEPKDCLVIEDGVNGAIGAVTAGMTVYGYTGASHMNEERIKRLAESGVSRIFNDMRELPKLINLNQSASTCENKHSAPQIL